MKDQIQREETEIAENCFSVSSVASCSREVLALARQHQLERIQEVCLRFGQSFALRNGGGNLLDKAGVSTLFGWLKNRSEFHSGKLPRRVPIGNPISRRLGTKSRSLWLINGVQYKTISQML
jgi:hypothetical protein